MSIKGIVLAGGYGTRLYPCTAVISKHLLPIYDKPMIFYSLSVLMLSGIKDILIITSAKHLSLYKKTFFNYNKIGLNIKFAVQKKPKGIAEALKIGKTFIDKSNFVLILGDNLFFGQGLGNIFLKLLQFKKAAGIVTYEVKNPHEFGVLELDNKSNPLRILEKPKKTLSKLAVTGIYFYQNKVLNFINKLKPSKRGELEITSFNNIFLKKKDLTYEKLGRGFSWLDNGTCSNLLEASQFVETIEKRQGYKIACLEEIALRKKFISKSQLKKIIKNYPITDYKKYLQKILDENL